MYRKALIVFTCLCLTLSLDAGVQKSELPMETIESLFRNVNARTPSPAAHIAGVFTVARSGDVPQAPSVRRFDLKWSGHKVAARLDRIDVVNGSKTMQAGGSETIKMVLTESESRTFYGEILEEGEIRGTGIIKDAPNPSTRSTDDLDRILRQAGSLTVPNFDPGKFLDAYREKDGEQDLIFVVFRCEGLIYRIGFLLNEGGVISRYEAFINGEKKLEIRHEKFITTKDDKRFPSLVIKKRFKTTYIPIDLLKRLKTPYNRAKLDDAKDLEYIAYTVHVDSADLNPVLGDEDFQLGFPTGITVTDDRNRKEKR